MTEDDRNALARLVAAIENYIDVAEVALARQGLRADRNRIRDRLLHPDNRYMLLPDA
jgi:hypothetical protein